LPKAVQAFEEELLMAQAVRDIMSKDVQSVQPDSTLKDAAQLLKSRDIGSVPVVEGRRIGGILTDRDIAIRGVAEGRDPGSTRVSEVMSKDVVTVQEDADLQEAERLMHDHQLRRLPVVNAQGELVGYLAMAKVARTETPEKTGKVLQGVSQASKPAPMDSGGSKRRQKTG
jgi:CBS domain-containing protein